MNVQEQVSDKIQVSVPGTADKSAETVAVGAVQGQAIAAPQAEKMPGEEQIMEILKNVYDPEIMMNIVDLGLVYGVEAKDGLLKVKMTLTSMACPLAPMIEQDVILWGKRLIGIREVKVEMVFTPPWTPARMSQEARLMLGMDI